MTSEIILTVIVLFALSPLVYTIIKVNELKKEITETL